MKKKAEQILEDQSQSLQQTQITINEVAEASVVDAGALQNGMNQVLAAAFQKADGIMSKHNKNVNAQANIVQEEVL